MKRCPKCASSFADTLNFCEFDGARLTADYLVSNPDLAVPDEEGIPETGPLASEVQPVSDPDLSRDDESSQTEAGVGAGEYQVPRDPRAGPPRQDAKLFGIVAVAVVAAVVAVGLLLFFAYQRMTRPPESSSESSNVALTQQPVPLMPSRPSPFDSPSPEPSPSPSPIASPTPQAESARLALSSSPVSTGGSETTRRGPVTIRLTDGTSIEAEEVWETKEGIWYRRRGVVTLLERDQVKAIEHPSPAPSTSATPSISPGTTP